MTDHLRHHREFPMRRRKEARGNYRGPGRVPTSGSMVGSLR